MSASLSINNPVIGISFSRLNAAKRNIGRAQEEARYEGESLSRAINSLHVSNGRLRMKAEALNSMRNRVNSRQENLQRIGIHIDYAVKRFQETDNSCAQRIKTNGYECRKVLGLKTSGGLFGDIISGITSVIEKGKAAWGWVKANGTIILDCIQTGLDIIGLIPGLGEIADGLNALIYIVRGDTAAAALSLAAMIPIAGCAATAGKFIYKGVKAYKGAKNFVKVIDKAKDIYGIFKKVGNKGIQKIISKGAEIFENVNRVLSKRMDVIAEGVRTIRGQVSEFAKARIQKMKQTPVQKNFNAIYKKSGKGISEADRIKLSEWAYPPKDELYLKYKDIYDNPKYFRQTDGYAYHPGTKNPELGYTDVNKDGFLNGEFTPDYTVEKGKVIDRFGDNSDGQYFSPLGESYESRALAPYMDTATYTKYQVLKPFNVKSGTIAPWWGREGMGTQFFTDYLIEALDGTFVKATVENLKANKYIIELID